MDVFAVDEFIVLVERLIGLPWPIRLDQFDSTARQIGWFSTNMPGFFAGNFASGEQRIMVTKDEDMNISVISYMQKIMKFFFFFFKQKTAYEIVR